MTNDELKTMCYQIIDLINYQENIAKLNGCNTCGKSKSCIYVPKLGEYERINCFAWEGEG